MVKMVSFGMIDLMNGPDGATPLEPEELEGLKFKSVRLRAELDQLESINIESGIKWTLKLKDPDILSEAFLRELHKRLLGDIWDWAGSFRKTEKNIGVDPLYIGVEIRTLLDDCNAWLEYSTYPPLEIAVRFHHRLVKIHPFPNGNGRHSRVMADLLCQHKLKINYIDWSGGQNLQQLSERRTSYIAALRKADGHDYSDLISFAQG
jgi:Fic-DOC domain mobile mystery protein B